jgi:hypothetical protein
VGCERICVGGCLDESFGGRHCAVWSLSGGRLAMCLVADARGYNRRVRRQSAVSGRVARHPSLSFCLLCM